MRAPEVIIIGGGIAGSSTALQLALRGRSVLLLEKDVAGAQASGVNAGGVRRLWRAIPEIPLSLAAHEMWRRIESLVDSDCGFQACGQISVAENESEMKMFADRVEELRALGYDHEVLVGKKRLMEILPALSDHCVGGLYCAGDGAAEPYKTTKSFFEKAKRLGVQTREGCRVRSLERTSGLWRVVTDGQTFEAPVVVNCAGAWGARIAEMMGDQAPLEPEAHFLTVTARMPKWLGPVVLTEGRRLSFKQMPNGTVVVGGGYQAILDFETEKSVLDLTEMRLMARTVTDLFPVMKKVPIVRWWPGILGIMKDHIPIIGPSLHSPDAYHAFGFSGHGFQLGPITGKIVSDLVVDGRTGLPIEAFSPARFEDRSRSGPQATG